MRRWGPKVHIIRHYIYVTEDLQESPNQPNGPGTSLTHYHILTCFIGTAGFEPATP